MTEQNTEPVFGEKKRIFAIDLIRGICVFLMIFDHTMYDLWDLLPSFISDYPEKLRRFALSYWTLDIRLTVRVIVAFVFLFLTGICCSFSKSNLKRGLKLSVMALCLTALSFAAGKLIDYRDTTICFGVLHCIALSLLIIALIERAGGNKYVFLALGCAFFITGLIIRIKYGAPYVHYGDENTVILVLRCIVGINECGGDSFPIFLNGGQVFLGVFFGKLVFGSNKERFSGHYINGLFTFFGRHSLPVYILHQAIIPILLSAIFLAFGHSIVL